MEWQTSNKEITSETHEQKVLNFYISKNKT